VRAYLECLFEVDDDVFQAEKEGPLSLLYESMCGLSSFFRFPRASFGKDD
jgi:hypothetical protein